MADWRARLRDIAALGGAALVGSGWGCGRTTNAPDGAQDGDSGVYPPMCNANPDPCCSDPGGASCASEKQCIKAPNDACCAMWSFASEAASSACAAILDASVDQTSPIVDAAADCGTKNPDPCCVDPSGSQCAAAMQCGNAPTPACCAMWGMYEEAFLCSMLCNADPDPCCLVASGPQNPSGCEMSQQQCTATPTTYCCTTLQSDGITLPACESADGGAREGGPDAAVDGGTDAPADAASRDATPDGD